MINRIKIRHGSKSIHRSCRRVGLVLLTAVFLAGCGDRIGYDAGTRPDTALLDSKLKIGRSTMAEVRATLGEPVGRGGVMLPVVDIKPRDSWTYYYEDSSIGAAPGRSGIDWNAQRIFLFVYFDKGRYDGYLWFSSLPDSKS